MSKTLPRIIGTGWAVPTKIRLNDDPIFDWLRQHPPASDPFKGYKERHVLNDGETLATIMVPAAKMAMENAGVQAADIDMLIGLGSISEYYQPNMLSQVHFQLGLPPRAWAIPVGNDYSNYGSSLMLADALVRTGRAKNVLICIGGNWTHNVDYHTPQSVSAADGAGAAVVSMSTDTSKWHLLDQCTVMDTQYYGTMYTDGLKLLLDKPQGGYKEVYTPHFFQITPAGGKAFGQFGEAVALTAVTQLLSQNGLMPEQVSFMPHQTSQVLIDYWLANLPGPPAQVLTTIEIFANVTVATHALNLAYFEEQMSITQDLLVMMALGPDMHCNAALLKRG